jgi:hypothetical protein
MMLVAGDGPGPTAGASSCWRLTQTNVTWALPIIVLM